MSELVLNIEFTQQFKINDAPFSRADIANCLFDMSNGEAIFNLKGGDQIRIPFSECYPFGDNSVNVVSIRS